MNKSAYADDLYAEDRGRRTSDGGYLLAPEASQERLEVNAGRRGLSSPCSISPGLPQRKSQR